MKLNRTNILLAALLVVVVLTTALVRVDYSQPNFEIYLGDDMTYSPAYQAYQSQPTTVFANGRTLQAPVPGTIARGHMPLHFEATREDAVRAGEQLQNPYAGSDDFQASAQRGDESYQVFCVACHGSGGAGDGPVAERGFPPPPSLLTGKSLQMKDGQLFHILTYGQNSMPAFPAQLAPDARWDVVNFIRNLQQEANASAPPDEPSEDTGAAEPAPGNKEDKLGERDNNDPTEQPPKDAEDASDAKTGPTESRENTESQP